MNEFVIHDPDGRGLVMAWGFQIPHLLVAFKPCARPHPTVAHATLVVLVSQQEGHSEGASCNQGDRQRNQ